MTHFPKPAFPALCLASLTAAWPAMLCADSGQLVTKTELRAKAEASAPAVAQLAAGTAVDIGGRQGAFYQVKTAAGEGFVRMLTVRLTSVVRTSEPPPSGVIALSPAARSSTTVATGIRGLSRTDIERANENPAAVAELERYRVTLEEARQFGAAMSAQAVQSPASEAAQAVPQKGMR